MHVGEIDEEQIRNHKTNTICVHFSAYPVLRVVFQCFSFVHPHRPASVFISVVFPAPLGPIIAVTRPGRQRPVTPLSTLAPLERSTRPSRMNVRSIIVSRLSRSDCRGSTSCEPTPPVALLLLLLLLLPLSSASGEFERDKLW